MFRKELIDRLVNIQAETPEGSNLETMICDLIDEIEAHGVLDVQAPEDTAIDLGLPMLSPTGYVRDLDGTGSLHACSEGDPGAIPFYTFGAE